MAANDDKKSFLHKGKIQSVNTMYEVVCDCGRVSYNSTKRCDNPHCSASQDLPVVAVTGLHKPGDSTADQVHFVLDPNAEKSSAKPSGAGV